MVREYYYLFGGFYPLLSVSMSKLHSVGWKMEGNYPNHYRTMTFASRSTRYLFHEHTRRRTVVK